MDRKQALEIMGLNEGVTAEEITKRMDILFKKFKYADRDKAGHTFQDVENAYRVLNGIPFKDEKEEEKINYRKSHPNPILKLLKVDEEKARNFIYYHKWHMVIAVAVIALVVSMIVSMTSRIQEDLKVLVVGDLYLGDTAPLEERIRTEIPEVREPLVQNVYLSETSDPQVNMAMQTKFTVEVAAGKNDIFILDEETYIRLAKQGAFKPIQDILPELGSLSIENSELESLKVALELDDGNTYTPELYGLDVSKSPILRDSEIIGERMIVALGPNGSHGQNAIAFVKLLLD